MVLPFVGIINLTPPVGTPTGEGLCKLAFGLVTSIFSLVFPNSIIFSLCSLSLRGELNLLTSERLTRALPFGR